MQTPVKILSYRIVFIYGAITAAMLIAYFLLLYFAGLYHFQGLRFIHYLCICLGMWLALRTVRKQSTQPIPYLPATMLSFCIAAVAAALFTIFLCGFAAFFDASFLNMVWPGLADFHANSNLAAFGFFTFSANLLFSVVLSLLVIFLFRTRYPENN